MLSWQRVLTDSITDPQVLIKQLGLQALISEPSPEVLRSFKCRVPQPYFDRILPGDPTDPLLRQVLPINQELTLTPGYTLDPLQEAHAMPCTGLLHKYHGRVLIPLTGACAINCRYCFRRHFPYSEHSYNQDRWNNALQYIQKDQTLHEVIFSGGDPLILKDQQLETLFNDIDSINHIRTLRIHTRLPVVIPERITPQLQSLCQHSRKNIVIVIHCNHANEIDQAVKTALNDLKDTGATLLNQSVLLRGVNDTAQALIDLSHALFNAHVLPYYLHLLDPVQGTAHFNVDQQLGKQLISTIRTQLPGYLVPRLSLEQAQHHAKTIIA